MYLRFSQTSWNLPEGRHRQQREQHPEQRCFPSKHDFQKTKILSMNCADLLAFYTKTTSISHYNYYYYYCCCCYYYYYYYYYYHYYYYYYYYYSYYYFFFFLLFLLLSLLL